MKKINSIGYGPAVLASGLILAIPVPILVYFLQVLLGQKYYFMILIKISVGVGVLILLSLAILLRIELKQDEKINTFYEKNKHTKIKISNGHYECQYCGSKKVREDELTCSVCGIKFINRL